MGSWVMGAVIRRLIGDFRLVRYFRKPEGCLVEAGTCSVQAGQQLKRSLMTTPSNLDNLLDTSRA